MAYYFIFPEADTTLYSHPDRLNLNTGKDEILEIVKEIGTTDKKHYPSRVLIKFPTKEVTDVIENTIGSSTFNLKTSCSIQLYSTEHKNLTKILNLQSFPVSQSWHEGSGRFSNLPTGSDGASWEHRHDSDDGNKWINFEAGVGYSEIFHETLNPNGGFVIEAYTSYTSSLGGLSYYPMFYPGTTGSISSSAISHGGGTWWTGSGFSSTQQFLQGNSLDIDINVTDALKKHSASFFASQIYPDGIPNHGFIIKQPDSVEANTTSSFGEMQYFSVDTKTIYPPRLTFKWDDSVHTKQSVAKKSGECSLYLYGNKEEYNQNDEVKFKIHVRDKYPTRTFATSSNYLNVNYLTTSSYYSIRDAKTEEEIIPFDNNFTKMSTDSNGMFFKIYMKGLQPERYYRILFKHENNDGITVYDNDYYFKVVR